MLKQYFCDNLNKIAVKFDDLLAQYLYENKALKLQGIGTFTLDEKVALPSPTEKEIYYPIDGLSFIYNPKIETDEALITFLVKKLAKIQPLVRSDLDSYLSNMKQFINIGKPYTIEGIGTLNKNNQGTYEFTPGNFLPVKEELNPRRENPDHNYHLESKGSSAGRMVAVILIVLASLAALGGIGWGLYTLFEKQDNTTQNVLDTDSLETSITPDTTNPQTIAPVTSQPTADEEVPYKLIFEITRNKERAIKRTAQLNVLKIKAAYDTATIGDTLRYRLYTTMPLKAADTIRVKDSLRRFFNKSIILDRQ